MSIVPMPPAASSIAPHVDALFDAVLGTTTLVALGILVALVWFGVRYRAGSRVRRHADVPAAQARARRRVEVAWIVIPLLLFFAAFGWAARLYVQRAAVPAGAAQIDVVARQWMWKFQHAGGQREIDELHVARGMPVRLVMTSQDVIHSFFVPAFRVKQDVLPGRYTDVWFTPTLAGRFHLFCAEYCGTDHAAMGSGDVVVLEPVEFQRWLAGHPSALDAAARGAALFRENGCSGCHGASAAVHAPDLAGLYGRPVPLSDGSVVTADERYLRDAILLPRRQVAAGYAPIMPSFAGRIAEDDLLDLIAYIRSLADKRPAPR
jgi:cytochrome c oxidase subunit II